LMFFFVFFVVRWAGEKGSFLLRELGGNHGTS